MSRAMTMAAVLAMAPCIPANAQDRIRLHNLADDFADLSEDTRGLPDETRVAEFHSRISQGFPLYYSAGTLTEGDEVALNGQITMALDEFPAIRQDFLRRVERFAATLQANVHRFRTAFSDFDDDLDIYLIHSLGRMNGGTRDLGGKTRLIFGVDMMSRLHHWQDDSAFFQHELFHIHHAPRFDECERVWCALWSEGLATHVAASLVPDAGHDELLLTIPESLVPQTDARWNDALIHLRDHLDSEDEAVIGNLFQFGSGEFPPRHGYYLGWRVVQHVAAKVPLNQLVELGNEAVRPMITEALESMISEGLSQAPRPMADP